MPRHVPTGVPEGAIKALSDAEYNDLRSSRRFLEYVWTDRHSKLRRWLHEDATEQREAHEAAGWRWTGRRRL